MRMTLASIQGLISVSYGHSQALLYTSQGVFQMSRLAVFTAAAVLSALTAIPAAFAKEHHRVHKARQFTSEQFRNSNAAAITVPTTPSGYLPGAPSMYTGGWSAPAGH
jgi:hypothetical protein